MGRLSNEAPSPEEFGKVFAKYYYRADSYGPGSLPSNAKFQLVAAPLGLVPICHFSGHGLGVRRNWTHIRAAPSKIYVIWFPLEGSISVTQDLSCEGVATAGDVVVTCGDRPFHIKAFADHDHDRCSQMHVLVPAHVMRTHLPEIDKLCGRVFHAEAGGGVVARELFAALFRESAAIEGEVAERLGMAGLEAIAQVLRNQAAGDLREDGKDARLKRILTYVRKNVSVAGLTVDDVARGCQVSRRYVHYLMKNHNESFSSFLWKCRLEQAHEWLTSKEFEDYHIADIAYMSGFRSASHFSHAYRSRYGFSPRESRNQLSKKAN